MTTIRDSIGNRSSMRIRSVRPRAYGRTAPQERRGDERHPVLGLAVGALILALLLCS